MPRNNSFSLILTPCSNDFPIKENISKNNYKLVANDYLLADFPELTLSKMGRIIPNN